MAHTCIANSSKMVQFSVEELKTHLNIDQNFHEDDLYLRHLCRMAEDIVELHIDQPLDELKDKTTKLLPHGLRHAMLLLIGNMYANRESVAYTSAIEIPYAYKYIVDLYRNYDNAGI